MFLSFFHHIYMTTSLTFTVLRMYYRQIEAYLTAVREDGGDGEGLPANIDLSMMPEDRLVGLAMRASEYFNSNVTSSSESEDVSAENEEDEVDMEEDEVDMEERVGA